MIHWSFSDKSLLMLENLRTRADLHLARKLFHMTGVLSILMCIVFLPRWLCWNIYFVLGIPLVVMDFLRPHSPALNRFSLKVIGPVIRKHEVRKASGSSYAILGIGLAYLLLPPLMAQLGVLFLAIGDPVASLCGLLWSRGQIWKNKSLTGLAAAMVSCSIASFIFLKLASPDLIKDQNLFVISLVCGLVAGFAELVQLFKLDDNLTIPLVSGGWLSLISFVFLGGVA